MEAVKPSGPLGRRPEVDGLRAVAVAAVMLYHFGLGCPGGFAGVDVFFVISGYLIVGILLREMDHGGFSFAQFWARRVRRLFPALAAVLCFTLAASWRMLGPREFESLGAQTAAALAFLAKPILALGCVWLALMGVSLWVKLERGFESAYDARFDPVARRVMQSPDGKAHVTHEALGSLERGGIQVGEGVPRIVILGDSHVVMFGPMLEELARRRGPSRSWLKAAARRGRRQFHRAMAPRLGGAHGEMGFTTAPRLGADRARVRGGV